MAGGGDDAAAARNKMVVLKRHVTRFPTEEDMEVVVDTVPLRVPAGSPALNSGCVESITLPTPKFTKV